jgi:general stress protein 26
MSPEDPAVVSVLRRSMVARIATLSKNGRPSINPLYFVYVDGHIHLGTADRTLAAFNVRANPNVAILFNVEQDPTDRRVLRVRGRATVRTDPEICRPYLRRDVQKYILNLAGLRNMMANARLLPLMHSYVTSRWKGKSCVLDVTPEVAEFLPLEETAH